jgi:hypothetical protein
MIVSLHFYFPELVKSIVKWMIYVVVSGKQKRIDFAYHWPKFFEVADEHFETEQFEEFYAKHFPDFDERALEYFDSDDFLDNVVIADVDRHFKIPHERPPKHQHYAGIHKFWCQVERDRIRGGSPPPADAKGKGSQPRA